jgi:hypothetical protein
MVSEEEEGGSVNFRCCMKCVSTYPALCSPVVRLSVTLVLRRISCLRNAQPGPTRAFFKRNWLDVSTSRGFPRSTTFLLLPSPRWYHLSPVNGLSGRTLSVTQKRWIYRVCLLYLRHSCRWKWHRKTSREWTEFTWFFYTFVKWFLICTHHWHSHLPSPLYWGLIRQQTS